MKKLIPTIITIFVIISLGFAQTKQGKHIGEQNMLDVKIEFSEPFGKTVTNSKGTFYYYYNWLIGIEDKVYPSEYWGEFPLYFFGLPTKVLVKITNLGPRNKTKVAIKTESYVLKTDGSNGAPLKQPETIEVEVNKGETKLIDASFTAEWTPEADSGLDRFIVKVIHINEGGGHGNLEPAVIMQKEGVFCPPKYKPEK